MKHVTNFLKFFAPVAFAPLFFVSVTWVATLGSFSLLYTMHSDGAMIAQVFCTIIGAVFGFVNMFVEADAEN